MDANGSIGGGAGTNLLVGDQSAGSVGGVILNGGSIDSGTLAFGAAEGVIYASGAGGTISAAITGSDLTLSGPGSLTLAGAGALSGSVVINAGKLVMASSVASATGDAPIFVNAGATLEAAGLIAGRVNLGNAATLLLSDGALTGGLSSTADLAPPAPPAVLQGSGVVGGSATYGGAIQSGATAGLITFTDDVTLNGQAAFYWRLQSFVDDSNGAAGVDWNGLVFTSSNIDVGVSGAPLTVYYDFSALGSDPDGGAEFWNSTHTWTVLFAEAGGSYNLAAGNFSYASGYFNLAAVPGTDNTWTATVTWLPSSKPRSFAERWRKEALARPLVGR